jgi:hypothetical protein
MLVVRAVRGGNRSPTQGIWGEAKVDRDGEGVNKGTWATLLVK